MSVMCLFIGGPECGKVRDVETVLPGYHPPNRQMVLRLRREVLAAVVRGDAIREGAQAVEEIGYDYRRMSLFGRTVHAYVQDGLTPGEADTLAADYLLSPLAKSLIREA